MKVLRFIVALILLGLIIILVSAIHTQGKSMPLATVTIDDGDMFIVTVHTDSLGR